VKITKTYEVTRCYGCPHFNNHPQEATCDMIKELYFISHRVAEVTIDEMCPFIEPYDIEGNIKKLEEEMANE
jgi:hypothetical protein